MKGDTKRPAIRAKAPLRPLDMLRFIRNADDTRELSVLLSTVDWSGVCKSQIFFSVLGRLAAEHWMLRPSDDFIPPRFFTEVFLSGEFQDRSASICANAYAHKKRITFLHIPKCAGTSVLHALEQIYPYFPFTAEDSRWVSKDDLLHLISVFSKKAESSSKIFFGGHRKFSELDRRSFLRFGDEAFTVIRDPVEMIISKVNFVTEKMLSSTLKSLENQPDVTEWLDSSRDPSYLMDCIKRQDGAAIAAFILFDQGIIEKDSMCTYLGEGSYDSAMDNLYKFPFKVTSVIDMERFLRKNFRVQTIKRENVSVRTITKESVSIKEKARIQELAREDSRLYGILAPMIEASPSGFVFFPY